MFVLRLLAAFSLMFLPGAWLAFARPGAWLPMSARVGLAGALSPVVVVVEYFALRAAGMPVQTTAWILVALNLPAAWLVLRQRPTGRVVRASAVQSAFILGLLAVGVSVPWHVNAQLRIFESHTLMHTAIVNQFVAGTLLPEEPEMAGLPLAYPWLSHVYWATLGVVLDWAPTRVYVMTNLVWLAWTALGVYAAGVALGARGFASRAGVLWLTLGTNVVGAAISWMTGWLPGDIRYTPWVRKYVPFNDMPFALALLASLIALAILAVRRKDGRHALLLGAVLGAAGAVYPLVLPGALAVAGLVPLVLWFEVARGRGGATRDVLVYAGALAAGAVAAALVLKLTVLSRATSGVELSSVEAGLSKLASAVIVLAASLVSAVVGVVAGLRERGGGTRRWLDQVEPAFLLLLLASLATVLAAAVFHLQGDNYNEYKLTLCAALSMAPFVAIALDRTVAPRGPFTIVVILSGVMLAPLLFSLNPWDSFGRTATAPPATEDGVSVHLATSAEEAGWTNAIRLQTPPNTVVVVATSRVYVPAATARALYAPVIGVPFEGYWFEARDYLIEGRGYPKDVVDGRLAVVKRLLSATNDHEIEAAWNEVMGLGRPVAVLASTPQNDGLLAWLTSRQKGRRLFQDESGRVVWFYPGA